LVEQRIENPRVDGSIPSQATKDVKKLKDRKVFELFPFGFVRTRSGGRGECAVAAVYVSASCMLANSGKNIANIEPALTQAAATQHQPRPPPVARPRNPSANENACRHAQWLKVLKNTANT
jgi:hypothetical protein